MAIVYSGPPGSIDRLAGYFLISEDRLWHAIKCTASKTNVSEQEVVETILQCFPKNVVMSVYSDKSFVVRFIGDEEIKISTALKRLGGSYNERLRGGPGYIFPMWKGDEVRRYLVGLIFTSSRYETRSAGINLGHRPRKVKIPPPLCIRGRDTKRSVDKWNFYTITARFPYSNVYGDRTGADYKKLIPAPRDRSLMSRFEEVTNLFRDDQKYLPSEALFMVASYLYGPSLGGLVYDEGGATIRRFSRDGTIGGTYWITGKTKAVEDKIAELSDEYPQNPYSSQQVIRRLDDDRAEAYFYYGSSD